MYFESVSGWSCWSKEAGLVSCSMRVEGVQLKTLAGVTTAAGADLPSPYRMARHCRDAKNPLYKTMTFISLFHLILDDEDPWMRTTDFTGSGAIGHCHFYKSSFSPGVGLAMDKAKAYFKGQEVSIGLSHKQLLVDYEPGYDKPNANPFFSVPEKRGISFEIEVERKRDSMVREKKTIEDKFGWLVGEKDTSDF
ncbi:RNA-dependent RNA polymerase 6 [Nymphaea thermarum]|nr:RNA-dependent RNA polymerase 6 [Nymphaea thermarum]